MRIYSPGERIGPYELLKALPGNSGGMAAVYLARPRPGAGGPAHVALKVAQADRGQADFLKYEVEHLLQLCDEHILAALPIPGLFSSSGQPVYIAKAEPRHPRSPWYFAMEYMRGGSLAQLLAGRGRLGWAAAVEIAWQAAVALSRVHARQLVHLDVKPSNLLLREPISRWFASRPQVVIADFGIAWPAGSRQPGPLYGSAPYIAPERAAGLPPQPWNDVFSLGVVLYEMITGCLPFASVVTPGARLDAERREHLAGAELPRELAPVILRALATDPRQRYQHVRQLRRALEALPHVERPGWIEPQRIGGLALAQRLSRLGVAPLPQQLAPVASSQ